MARKRKSKRGTLRLGTSGYQYDHWKKIFYPEDLPKKQWFDYYAERFDAVEINNTFYNVPEPKTFDHWREQAPSGFEFTLKFSRFGTHMKKLKDPDQTVDYFLERAERLRSRLGPILAQLPPGWGFNAEQLDEFLRAAPRRHRWAVEIRDESWLNDECYDILRRHNAALCIHDIIEDHPWRITADWTYIRFHGSRGGRYAGNYSPQLLSARARKIKRHLADGLDAYVYFNNDAHGHAIHNAADLRRYITG